MPSDLPTPTLERAAPPRPLQPEDQVVILGAGPAGCWFAASLVKRGHSRVTILERADRIGGRCVLSKAHPGHRSNDLGACASIPTLYADLLRETASLGLQTFEIPRATHVDTLTGRRHGAHFSLGELARAGWEGLGWVRGYGGLQGTAGPAITTLDPRLRGTWRDVERREGLRHLGIVTAPVTDNFGYRSTQLPAVIHARLLCPTTLGDLLRHRVSLWEGGTPQIWERLVAAHELDVRLQQEVLRIRRDGEGATLEVRQADGQIETMHADYLVMACPPRGLLHALDATPTERWLWQDSRALDYRAFEFVIPDLAAGQRSMLSFRAQMRATAENQPLTMLKRHLDDDTWVVYVNAGPGAEDDAIVAHLADALDSFGARLGEVLSVTHHAHSPHPPVAQADQGFYARADANQWVNRTAVVGASLAVDLLCTVTAQAEHEAQRLLTGAAAGLGLVDAARA